MAGFLTYLTGRKGAQDQSQNAIVGLRQQLQMIEKKEEYTRKKIEEELAKAKANAVTNKAGMSIRTYSGVATVRMRCCSFPRRAKAEEDVGQGSRETGRNEASARGERQHARGCEPESGDYEGDEGCGQRSEEHSREHVFSFRHPAWVRALICVCVGRSTRWTRLWRTSRNKHNLRTRSRNRFRAHRLVLILMRCVASFADTRLCWNFRSASVGRAE